MSRAREDEMTFVLLARDVAAPATIRFWMAERIRLGKNKPGDAQIVEAETCAARLVARRNLCRHHGSQDRPSSRQRRPKSSAHLVERSTDENKETEMIGNNKLHLNTETMIEAMQQWIDTKMPNGAPTVTDVRVLDRTERTFVVVLCSTKPGPY